MTFVRTVLGDIDPSDLGVCYAHEHVVLDACYMTEKHPDFLHADAPRIVEELRAFHTAGGRAMIDSMPGGGAGRNVLRLAEVSREAAVHIVCPTGVHLPKYYPPGHWGSRVGEDELAAAFIGEIKEGIDRNDLAGPDVRRTPHRAGLIKVASGWPDRAVEERSFAAAAAAHRATGCPILTHTEPRSTEGVAHVERFRARGADLSRVVISHTDQTPDLGYHRELLAAGVSLEYDAAFRWKPGQPNHTLDLLLRLLADFPRQIMLGMDAARRTYWRSYGGADGGPGLDFLLTTFTAAMRGAGIAPEQIRRLFVDNPAQSYSFSPRFWSPA